MTKDTILEAGPSIVDTDGIGALTMRNPLLSWVSAQVASAVMQFL
ncbi:hypothetical protein [Actinoplanes siamensis]|nr:hypothetical protein [Actinoplanes siamensis]